MPTKVFIQDDVIDTLTVKFWRDTPGPNYKGKSRGKWACHIGPNFIEGCGGFGRSPLAALRDLCRNIPEGDGHYTDNQKLYLL